MKQRYRLTLMLLSLVIIILIGRIATGGFTFATSQFWFIAGALLLILLSLVDQPHFSKDANIFVNGATALVSLFTVPEDQRLTLWWVFAGWALYLILSSFVLMAIRSRELFLETKTVQLFSRLNRAIGRPESIFSAYFLWGIFLQFSYPKDGAAINSLLLFWSIFMILNLPNIAQIISAIFEQKVETKEAAGLVSSIQSPRIANAQLRSDLPSNIVGKQVALWLEGAEKVADGTLFEERVVKGIRMARIAITSFGTNWNKISSGRRIEITVLNDPAPGNHPVGTVAAGSSIGSLVFEIDPRISLHAGQVVKVNSGDSDSYYQIVAAKVADSTLLDGNSSQSVRVTAGQLGQWNGNSCSFDAIDWVPPAGELISVSQGEGIPITLPTGHCAVGFVPNSKFPVHVHLADSITHNTALIGVTGSGKSYLAFHLIEAYLDAGIKVLVLDLTRQHWQFLQHRAPTALTEANGVAGWLAGASNLAIYQFANATTGLPRATADFIEKAFDWLHANTRLRAGVDAPARLCIILEEAHSLIPEWNQVAQEGDKVQVNRAARIILQGRKFGLGCLLITQRTANVTKTVLNQCNTIFALRSFDQTGLDFLRNYMGEEYSQSISTLPSYTAVLVGKASSSTRPIILKITNFQNRWQDNQNGQQSA